MDRAKEDTRNPDRLWRPVASDARTSDISKLSLRLFKLGVNAACDECFFNLGSHIQNFGT